MFKNRSDLKSVKRVVVKVGTSSLSHANGKLNLSRIDILVRELVDLKNSGYEIILVSSGAVGAGIGRLNLSERPRNIPEKQALAAIGQGLLMHIYEKFMSEYGQLIAQVLLTEADLTVRDRFLNARNTLNRLLEYGAIPIINENDTVSYSELRLGDNDTLAALVAVLTDADLVVLMTDIDGLYTANPRKDKDAKLITEVREISSDLEKACDNGGSLGTGGMITKVKAAKIAQGSGIPLAIIEGESRGNINLLLSGETIGTLFYPREDKKSCKKKWISFGAKPQGKIIVDDGAKKALLEQGKSLLATGILSTEKVFSAGDIVSICDTLGKEFARGFTNYTSEEVDKVKGKKSYEIRALLGHHSFDEVIHRDNLGLV